MSKIKTKLNTVKKDKNAMDLLKSGGLVLVFKVLGALSGYIFTFIVAKKFGAANYGTFEIAFTVLMIAAVVVKLGLDTANVKFTSVFLVEKAFGKIKSLYSNSVLTIILSSAIAGILVYVLRNQFEIWFSANELSEVMIWVSVGILPFALMQYNAEALRGFKAMSLFSIYQQGSILLLAAGALYFFPADLFSPKTQPIAAFTLSAIVIAIFSFISYRKTYAKKVSSTKAEGIDFKSVLKVGVPMLVSGSLFLVMSWTDTLMIGYFKTEADVGIYRAVFKISTLITFTQFAVNSIAAPTIAQFYSAKNIDGLRVYVKQIGWLNLILSTPIFLIIVIFKEQLAELFGAEFTEGAYIIPVLAIGQLVNALCGPVMYILNMTGKEKLTQNIMLWMSIVNLGLNAALIPKYGIMGAAVATSFSMIAWNVIAAIWVYKYYRIVSFPWIK